MTTPLTPTPNPLPSIVNIPSDGEDVDSASVALYVQTIINALAYQGKVFRHGNAAAMKALTGVANGELFYVDTIGWFFFALGASLSSDKPFYSYDATSGDGVWFNCYVANAGSNLAGIATYGDWGDGTTPGKIAQKRIPNVTTFFGSDYLAEAVTTSTTDVTLATINSISDVQSGDYIEFSAAPQCNCLASFALYATININGSGDVRMTYGQALQLTSAGVTVGVPLIFGTYAGGTGTCVVKIKGHTNDGAHALTMNPNSGANENKWIARIIRP